MTRADAGTVCTHARDAGLALTVFVSATPLRVGPAEVAVLVQDAVGAIPRTDARVDPGLLLAGDLGRERRVARRAGMDPNRLLYAATVSLDATGPLSLRADVEREGPRARGRSVRLDVAEAATPLLAWWALVALPPFAIALYAGHGVLARRQAARRRQVRRPDEVRPGLLRIADDRDGERLHRRDVLLEGPSVDQPEHGRALLRHTEPHVHKPTLAKRRAPRLEARSADRLDAARIPWAALPDVPRGGIARKRHVEERTDGDADRAAGIGLGDLPRRARSGPGGAGDEQQSGEERPERRGALHARDRQLWPGSSMACAPAGPSEPAA